MSPYYPTIEEDLVHAREILERGKDAVWPHAVGVGPNRGTIYGGDTYAAYKLLESFVAEIERLQKSDVLQAVLDAISGKLDPSTQIADHPNVKFAQMERLKLLARAEALLSAIEAIAPLTDAQVDAFLAETNAQDDPERRARIRAIFDTKRGQ